MELQDFLYEEVDLIGCSASNFYERNIKKKYSLPNRILGRILSFFLDIWLRRRTRKDQRANIFFLFSKFSDIIEAESKYFNVFVGDGITSIIKNKLNVSFINIYKANVNLFLGFLRNNVTISRQAVDYLITQFQKNDISLLILGNDKLFIERACVLAAKKLNIPVVCYQHGIYAGNVERLKESRGSKYADFFWCWGNSVKRTFMEAYNWPPEKITVVGYPYIAQVEKFREQCRKNALQRTVPKILFAGVYYSNFSKEDGEDFENLARLVFSICNELGYDFVYRCHTGENYKETERRYQDTPAFKVSHGRDLFDELSEASVVIGDQSSIMVEGALLGINAIQVIRDDRIRVSAQNPVNSFTYKVEYNREEIKKVMVSVIESGEPPKVNEDTHFLNKNIVEDIRDEILKITEQFSTEQFSNV